MDISGISTSFGASSQLSSSARVDLQSLQRSEANNGIRNERSHHGEHGRGRALGVFRQELQLSLKAQFHAKFRAPQPDYAQLQQPATPDDVAAEALGIARQLVAESPTQAAKSLITFRAKVHETVSYVRATVGDHDDNVDQAVARVDEGLDALDDDVANNRESSASVLAVDTSTRQRSTIQIRTQEGDVVKLSLRRMDSLSATDVSATDGNTTTTSTEVEISSRSRMMLKVEGDLNESELAAIQNVFAQAERIADEFFDGDLAAAFSLAEGFEFDTEQLARVNMRFKMTQESNVSYAESVRPVIAAPVSTPEPVAVAAPLPDVPAVGIAPEPVPVLAEANVVAPTAEEDAGPVALLNTSALSNFFESLGTFLRSVGEGFETGSSNASFSFHYSESFKLELLKAVIHTVAPDDSGEAAANAASLIDGLGDTEVRS